MATEHFDDLTIRLHPDDDVVVAKRAVGAGTQLRSGVLRLTAGADVPAGHKMAVAPVAQGAPVRKYGQVIGFASVSIAPGDHVHSHNLVARDLGLAYEYGTDVRPVNFVAHDQRRTFMGYLRPDGRVGTRNYVAIVSSVNCSASVSKYVAERFRTPEFRRDFPHVDGVLAFTHKGGCSMQPGDGPQLLQRVLAGVARHPNVFGYVMIGLGCEGNQVIDIDRRYNLSVLRPGQSRPAFMNIQQVGGVRKTVDAATEAIRALLPLANAQRRTAQPVSSLVLAENCGGSDGNSGITANPALGVASDLLVRQGGASVLAETTEIYGAEHLLTRRAVSREVGERLIEFVRWWERHAAMWGATIDNNPSPGNKQGGLTTIFEKSLGAIAKAGQSPLMACYGYAQQVTSPGLSFMDTPGYDPVSMTGLVAGGCTIGCFTTGRGSVFGCKPAPCLKVATNTAVYDHMIDDMDLNAGTILDGTETVEQVGRRIFERLIAVAGGEQTKSEQQGMGDEEFAPWPLGPTW